MFPAFLDLATKKVVVVGGGPVAMSKVSALLGAGAAVTVVAPEIQAGLERPDVTVVRRKFEPADLDDAWWVVAAGPPEVNRQVRAAGDVRRVFVNAVDDRENASAFLGGVVQRAGVTIAISTNGRAPALAALIREAVDAFLPVDLDRWMATAAAVRQTWRQDGVPMTERRPRLLTVLNDLYRERAEEPHRE